MEEVRDKLSKIVTDNLKYHEEYWYGHILSALADIKLEIKRNENR